MSQSRCGCVPQRHSMYIGKAKKVEITALPYFKSKRQVGSGNEIVDYSRPSFLGADQKERGLWERDCSLSIRVLTRDHFILYHSLSCENKATWLTTREENVNYGARWVDFNLAILQHSRVLLCLCFKTNLSAKPFIWKWVLHAVSFSYKSKSVS